MRETSLPSPGANAMMGHQLRRMSALAISHIQIAAARRTGGKHPGAVQLRDFFTACASALSAFIDTVAPTVTTRVRTAVNTVTITCSETLNASTSVPLTSFVFAPPRTVSAITVVNNQIIITAAGAVAGDTVTYTAPAAQGVADLAGNKLASFAAAAVA